jgi:hypothetical protein
MEINGIRLESFLSHRIEGMRGMQNLSFATADETASWPISEQQEVKDCLLGYIPKRKDFRLVLVSTAGYPSDIMANIVKEKNEECIFQRIRMDWHVAAGTLLHQEDLDKIRLTNQNTWLREFCLEHAGFQGNAFSSSIIEKSIKPYDLGKIDVDYGNFSLGIDLGSTLTGITLAQWNQADRRVYITYSDELEENLEYHKIYNIILNHTQVFNPDKIYIDASNSFLVRDLKNYFSEEAYDIVKERVQKQIKPYDFKDKPYECLERFYAHPPCALERRRI